VDAHVDGRTLECTAAGGLGTGQLHSSQGTGVTAEAEHSPVGSQRLGRIERVEQKADCYVTGVVEPHPAQLAAPEGRAPRRRQAGPDDLRCLPALGDEGSLVPGRIDISSKRDFTRIVYR